MQALFFKKFGGSSNDQLGELPIPVPKSGELLIKVNAAALNPVDIMQRAAELPKFLTPKLPVIHGFDFCGTVVKSPSGSRFKPGDAVFGMTKWMEKGVCAEYACVAEEVCTLKPQNVSNVDAASTVMVGITCLMAFERGGFRFGEDNSNKRVMILGGAGGIGTMAIQLAKNYYGIGFVATTASPGAKTELCASLGADLVVNYKDDPKFDQLSRNMERPFDFIIHAVGEAMDLTKRGLLGPGTKVIGLGALPTAQGLRQFAASNEAKLPGLFQFLLTTSVGKWIFNHAFFPAAATQKAYAKFGASYEYFAVSSSREHMEIIAGLLTAGKIKAVVDSVFDLKEGLQAMKLLEKGSAAGKICIRME